jgi:hypothetical protein
MRSAMKDETAPLLPPAYWGILLEVFKDRLTGPNVALECPVASCLNCAASRLPPFCTT